MDIKGWIEIASLIAGFLVLIGALKQGMKDQSEKLESIGEKVDIMTSTVAALKTDSTLHGEQITGLRRDQEGHERDSTIAFDEIKGAQGRSARKINQLDKWRTAADQEFKKLDPSWGPPVSND